MKLEIIKKREIKHDKTYLFVAFSLLISSIIIGITQPINKEPPYWDTTIPLILSLIVFFYRGMRGWVYKYYTVIGFIYFLEDKIVIKEEDVQKEISISDIKKLTIEYFDNAQIQTRALMVTIEGINNFVMIEYLNDKYNMQVKFPSFISRDIVSQYIEKYRNDYKVKALFKDKSI